MYVLIRAVQIKRFKTQSCIPLLPYDKKRILIKASLGKIAGRVSGEIPEGVPKGAPEEISVQILRRILLHDSMRAA